MCSTTAPPSSKRAWWLADSYGIYGGSSNEEATLIVVDANISGWSACIFRVVEIEDNKNYPLPFQFPVY
jgi:hypothetical protein